MSRIVCISIFIAVILTSCNKSVAPAEYVKYVENVGNGLKVSQQANGVQYTLQYQPTEYCVMLEKRSFNIPHDEFKEEYNRFKGLEHYTLKIDRASMDSLVNKLGDTSKYKKSVVEYFDFSIQKDIKLIEGNDTIPCAICEPDANIGISQYYTFSLGFSNKSESTNNPGDRVVLFSNKILRTGNVLLSIKGKDVKNIPVLNMM